jgi:hypothetical protein
VEGEGVTSTNLTILGAPRTKKNSGQGAIGRAHGAGGQPCPSCGSRLRVRVFPSAAWREWLKAAVVWIDGVRLVDAGGVPGLCREDDRGLVTSIVGLWAPLAEPVNCRAVFHRDADRGDLIGYCQGLADLLQERGVLADDKWIWGWDGSRLAVMGADRPRVEVELTAMVWAP